MKVNISQIRKTLNTILVDHGVSKNEATVLADEYLEGELQGKHSHGLASFPSIVVKLSKLRRKAKILLKTHSYLFLDARGDFGAVVGRQAVDWAIDAAKKEGVGLALIKNMTTWLRPATIAKYIADKAFVGLVMNNGGVPRVAPSGGYDPVIGTNPMGIGIPTNNDPILLDMATSKRAWGEVRLSEKFGKDLPPKTFFNKKGQFTEGPKDAYSVVGLGDYKGFGLGLFVEIMTGSLVQMLMGSHKLEGDYRTLPRGAMIMVVNPKMSTSIDEFGKANSRLVKEIKNSRKLKGVKEIVVPGGRALKTRARNVKRGYFEIEDAPWKEILDFIESD